MTKPTLTVAIPAYNEELGIGNILTSLLSQNPDGFILKKIVVYSDGSTDATNTIVHRLASSHPLIQLIAGRTRLGKLARLNQIFRSNATDILVTVDADIYLVGTNFLSSLVACLVSDPRAMVVAAHQIPLRSNTFIGKVLHSDYQLWDRVRLAVPAQDHVHNLYGAATAYRGTFVDCLHYPAGLGECRSYLYMMAKQVNGFRYCFSAQILYWPLSTLADYHHRASRAFGKNIDRLVEIFGPEAGHIHCIPASYRCLGLISELLNNPFYGTLAVLLNVYLRLFPIIKPINTSGRLERLPSTKKPFPI